MAAREDYYSFVEGDDIDSIILDRNILPLRKLPLLRGEDICYIIQNIAGRLHAAKGEYDRFEEFIKFSNEPSMNGNGLSCLHDLHEKLIHFASQMNTITSYEVYYGFVKKEASVPDKQCLGVHIPGFDGIDAMKEIGLLESFEDENETFLMYLKDSDTFLSYEKFITYCMDLFWNKMMRQVVVGDSGGMYFLNDQQCRFRDVKIYGTRRLYNDVNGETVYPIDHWDYLISISKSSTHSSDIFTPVGFTYQTKTLLGTLIWSQSPFLWPRYRARFTDGQKNKLYFSFSVNYSRRENRDDEVKTISTYAYVKIPRNEVSIETLKGEVMDYMTEIGVDTSDPTEEGGYVSLNVEIREVFAILEFTDQMTINTKGNDK